VLDLQSVLFGKALFPRIFGMKIYKMRSLAIKNGKNSLVDLRFEFDGTRAFAIWDATPVGKYELRARLELNPELLQRVGNPGYDFFYQGELVLPRPQDN